MPNNSIFKIDYEGWKKIYRRQSTSYLTQAHENYTRLYNNSNISSDFEFGVRIEAIEAILFERQVLRIE